MHLIIASISQMTFFSPPSPEWPRILKGHLIIQIIQYWQNKTVIPLLINSPDTSIDIWLITSKFTKFKCSLWHSPVIRCWYISNIDDLSIHANHTWLFPVDRLLITDRLMMTSDIHHKGIFYARLKYIFTCHRHFDASG